MYTTNPSQGERHYLQILLHHIPGATGYNDLKRSPDGIVHKTFKETALAYGVLESDGEWNDCLSEAAISFMQKQLCSLFVTILVFEDPAKPGVLLEKYKEVMGEDILRQLHVTHDLQKHIENEVLIQMQEELGGVGSCLEKFGLPSPDMQNRVCRIPRVIQEEMYDVNMQQSVSDMKCQHLNSDQHVAFNTIMKAVDDENHPQRMFFPNAPGGYGKTFLIEALLSTVQGMGKIALAVASSGIAAELLEGGRTAHS